MRQLKATLETLMRDKAVACGRKIEACLLVEALRVPDAETIAAVLASDFQKTTIGVYRLLCEVTPA
jgi:hypothetical protein